MFHSFSGHRNSLIFFSFHAKEPLVYLMQKGWWDISLGNEIGHFLEKSLVQNFIKLWKYLFIHLADIEDSSFLSLPRRGASSIENAKWLVGHLIMKRNSPFLRNIGSTKLHKNSKILIHSFSGLESSQFLSPSTHRNL